MKSKITRSILASLAIIAVIVNSNIFVSARTVKLSDVNNLVNLSDIEGHGFENYIRYLYQLGVVSGFADNTYKPDLEVTRGEMAKFIMNAFDIPENTGGDKFTDVDESHTFFKNIQTLKNVGIVSGYGDNTYRPNDIVTRGQTMKYINLAGNSLNQYAVTSSSTCPTIFSDTSGHTFEANICSVANYNREGGEEIFEAIVGGYSDGTFRPDIVLTRAQMAKIILLASTSIAKASLTNSDTFLMIEGFERPFSKPMASIKNLDSPFESDDSFLLEWDEMTKKNGDTTIQGYLLERYDDEDEEWTPIDSFDGVDGTSQRTEVDVIGTIAEGEEFTVDIGSAESHSYTSVSGDDTIDVAHGLMEEIDNNSDIASATRDGDDVIINIIEPGRSYNISTDTDSAAADLIVDEVRESDDGTEIRNGVIYLEALKNSTLVSFVDEGLLEDKTYKYRVAAFKFLPYKFSKDAYDSQDELREDSSNRDNMLIGPWTNITVKTDEED